MSGFRVVLFDWDGTLVDTCPLVLDAHNHVRAHFGLPPWTMHDVFGGVSKSARELFPEIYGERAAEGIAMLYGYIGAHYMERVSVLPGIPELLEALGERGVVMGVVSNKKHDALLNEVAHFGWDKYFSAVVGAGEAESDKPSPAPALLALKRLGLAAGAGVLYVGDTETDLQCAAGAGLPAAFITHGQDRARLVETYKPLIVVEDTQDLAKRLLAACGEKRAC